MNNLPAEQREHVARRLRSEPTIWVTTVRPDGWQHSTPVWFYWDGTYVYFGSQEQTRKVRNLVANPHVALALPDTQDVIVVEGDAEFVDGSDVGRVMAGYAQKYAQAMQAMGMDPGARQGFRLVRVTPRRVLAWGMPAGSDRVGDAQPTTEQAGQGSRRFLDLTPAWKGEVTLAELVADLTPDDLRELTNDMVDAMLDLIADCTDEDVSFVPADPEADDTYATAETERNIPWTLGHVIVHTTASAEESAAIAAELARGVEYHGRSRYEVPWRTVTTVEQCRRRLEESRRMRLASLDMWPDEPHLDNTYTPFERVGAINAIGAFVMGLGHDAQHLDQIAEIVRQARAARGTHHKIEKE